MKRGLRAAVIFIQTKLQVLKLRNGADLSYNQACALKSVTKGPIERIQMCIFETHVPWILGCLQHLVN